jgi:hypothetical protein
MSKIDINDLYTKFYLVVNDIIYDIHSNNYINKYLFYCEYKSLNITKKYNLPLTICLGGGGFIQYNHIFKNEKLINKIELESKDYDISFSFGTNNINNQIINRVKNELKSIYDNNIKSFKYNNLTQNSFKFTTDTRNDLLHCKIECELPNKYKFHIAEFSLWFNGKISDNFTINDFNKSKIYLYEKDSLYYYLLPLELLTKTLLYAIVDYFEKRNFNKCVKYLERVKFIKDCNKLYMNNHSIKHNNCLYIIFDSYKNQI